MHKNRFLILENFKNTESAQLWYRVCRYLKPEVQAVGKVVQMIGPEALGLGGTEFLCHCVCVCRRLRV